MQEAICAAFAHRGDLRSLDKFKPRILRIPPTSAMMPAADESLPWI